MSSGASSAPSPAAKVGKAARKGEVEKGLDIIINSTASSDVRYCASILGGDVELAAFCASMLRDGELQKALSRKRQSSLKRKLGRQLPDRCKRFRGLPKKFCEQVVSTILGRELFDDAGADDLDDDDDRSAAVKDPKAWARVLAYGLRVNTDLDLPQQHRFPRHEGLMLLVFQARAKDVNFAGRLKGINRNNFGEWGNYTVGPTDMTKIVCKFAKGTKITLPWTAQQIEKVGNLSIEDNDMMFEAVISNSKLDSNQKLYTLFRTQHPHMEHEVDNESFEYPAAIGEGMGATDVGEAIGASRNSEASGQSGGAGALGAMPPPIEAPSL